MTRKTTPKAQKPAVPLPLRLEWRTPEELADNPSNWRKHPEAQTTALAGAIREVGWAGAALYNEATGRLIDGHARKNLPADMLVDGKMPVLVGRWTEEQERVILLTLDPLSALAEASVDTLSKLLLETRSEDAAVQKMLDELGASHGIACFETGNGEQAPDPEPQIDRAAELQAKWGTAAGQLWTIPGKAGVHRVLCGDSTKAEDVGRLMAGAKASCVFTDPPYGVSQGAKNRTLNELAGKRGNTGRNRVTNDIVDDDLSPDDLSARLLPAFENIRTLVMADDCTLFVCAPQGGELSMMMMMMMQKACLKVRHVLIWVKNQPTFSLGRLDYDYQHEPILLTWGKRHKRPMNGQHQTSVWRIDKPRASADHPTMKPVELYANAYANNSERGDLVFDAYLGSGTALIAAENLSRICYGMEISPAYVAVILQRAADAGLSPVMSDANS